MQILPHSISEILRALEIDQEVRPQLPILLVHGIDILDFLIKVVVLILMRTQNLLLLSLTQLTVLNLQLLVLEDLLCLAGQLFTHFGHVDLVFGRSTF